MRKRRDNYTPDRPVNLYLGSSFAGAWENVLSPWLDSVARLPPASAPNAVVTPSRSLAYLLRSKLLARGISILGLEFLSPAQLREKLGRGQLSLALREHLRLLLAIAAERIAARAEENADEGAPRSEFLIAKSIARDPDHFLRAIDQLYAAGWTLNEMSEPGLREVADNFEQLAHRCSFEFVHSADRNVLAEAAKSPAVFRQLLITGFNGAHWPLWPLLQAAVAASEHATVLLADPREEARDLDEIWIGTWEETFGAAETISEAEDEALSPLQGLSQLPETPSDKTARAAHPLEAIHFLVGRDTPEQAKAIVALTAQFLQDEKCERIGILFPRGGALARTVARLFESARIAHNDGIAHLGPSVFADDAWRAWLELQQSPRLKVLLKFLRATEAEIFDLPIPGVEDALRRAYGDVLIDNVAILREYCARQERSERHAAIVRGLDKIHFLPARATFSEFLASSHKIFLQLNWKQHWSEIDRLTRSWAARLNDSFSRNLYLGWLGEVLGAPSLQRDEYGSHPYSRVHLLPYAEAEGQAWSHLIFAGLNEEAWPAQDDELGFIREQEIDEFNQQNRVLNRRAVQRGSQGEGQWSVRENKTLLIGASERRQIRRRQLSNLVESATVGLGATANLYSEASASRIANPSELFSRLYLSARGEGVSQQTLQGLEKQTREWLHHWSPVEARKIDSVSLGRTRYAYDARRQLRAASEYEFALRTPPDRPISLRVTEWEQALRYPAIVWMKLFLGVEAAEEDGAAWAIATGQWVHRWLADGVGGSATNEFVAIPEPNEIRARLLQSARRFRDEVQAICDAGAQSLPDWWTSGWGNALFVAESLADKLSGLSDWSHLAAEWKLDSPTEISLGANRALRVRGRIDLLLGRGKNNGDGLDFPELWIVDYKTGRQRGFDLRSRKKDESPEGKFHKQLVDGKGVQLALYALAAHALGAADARLTLLSVAEDLEPQFQLTDALAQNDFWLALHEMQESGVFGMLGPVHQAFGFGRTYPLATLPVEIDLLREKWVLTHPALLTETEEPERE